MELKCPSCGAKHNTDDFPDAFELQCSCGYSILLPDMDGIAADQAMLVPEEDIGFSAAPAALDVEDEDLQVSLEPDLDPLKEEAPRGTDGMTPPEQLPDEMPYDPFELPDTKQVQMEQQFGLEQDIEEFDPNNVDAVEGASEVEFNSNFELPSSSNEDKPDTKSQQEDAQVEDPLDSLASEAAQAPEIKPQKTEENTPAQTIVERVQLAGMGQLLGFSYDLEWVGVEKETLMEAKNRCLELMKDRPWLEGELKKREIDFIDIESKSKLSNLPEPIALEFYMACLELGGRCSFKKVD